MFPRSQEAAITRATECKVQTISAFGAAHPLAKMAAELQEALTAEANAMMLAPPVASEKGPV